MKRKRVITILIALIIYLGVAAADFQTLLAQAQGESKNTNEALNKKSVNLKDVFQIHAFLQVLFKPRPGGGAAAGAD